jgi:hypothetical protein
MLTIYFSTYFFHVYTYAPSIYMEMFAIYTAQHVYILFEMYECGSYASLDGYDHFTGNSTYTTSKSWKSTRTSRELLYQMAKLSIPSVHASYTYIAHDYINQSVSKRVITMLLGDQRITRNFSSNSIIYNQQPITIWMIWTYSQRLRVR